jgi:uncharacterized RDD family membrane protein YckC
MGAYQFASTRHAKLRAPRLPSRLVRDAVHNIESRLSTPPDFVTIPAGVPVSSRNNGATVSTPASIDPPPLISLALPEGRSVASVWRRTFAFLVDLLIVGIAASILALPFFDALSRLGAWGPLLGFCLSLAYFALFDSSIGKGQTLGKRLLHVQVVDVNGNSISFPKSLLRYSLFGIPYFLNGLPLPITRTPLAVSTLISFTVIPLGGANFYLMLFNRHTRQGIHDLAVGSYVADADELGAVRTEPIWPMHWAILGSLALILFLGALFLDNRLETWGSFPQLLSDLRIVEAMKGVQRGSVQDLTNWNNGENNKILVITAYFGGQSADQEAFADRIASSILQQDPTAQNFDVLRVNIVRAYDLGIAHASYSRYFQHTPAEWKVRLDNSPQSSCGFQPKCI